MSAQIGSCVEQQLVLSIVMPTEREAHMLGWFRRWYVPRAEYDRLVEDYSLHVGQLRTRLRLLEAQQTIDQMCSLEAFEICDELPNLAKATTVDNIIKVDFRRRIQA
jgi:hypothetical protein